MPLQDLTPQLRTRLNKMERAVGWFVFVATALLLAGFGYYIYHTAERKGWFKIKAPFHIFVTSSAGLKVGDPVYLMGFPVGEITQVQPQQPRSKYNVRVDFNVRDDFFRYLWTGGSYAKISAAGFLDQRVLEVTRATNGYALVVTQPVFVKSVEELRQLVAAQPGRWQLSQEVLDEQSNVVFKAYTLLTASNLDTIAAMKIDSLYAYDNLEKDAGRVVASWNGMYHRYKIFTPTNDSAYMLTVETPPVSDQLQAMVAQVQSALPNILTLTNKLAAVLENAANATSNLNVTLANAQTLPLQLQTTLTNANILLVGVDTNLDHLTDQVGQTLDNIAGITSNLNVQVQANSNMLWTISKTVMDADDFVQGLKHHWLLRSAFKTKATNQPAYKRQPPPKTR